MSSAQLETQLSPNARKFLEENTMQKAGTLTGKVVIVP